MRPTVLLVLLAGLLATAAVPNLDGAVVSVADEHEADTVYDVHYVPTVDDARIRVEIQRDARFDGDRQPVILTYSPYNNIPSATDGRTANDGLAGTYNELGFARAVADVIGTRGSTGCWDYGGAAEQQSGIDVVKFLAGVRPDEDGVYLDWSNGSVGMIGGSYNGTTATMVAARGDEVPELKAIVPQAAISRWYGYAYEHGVRYFLNSFEPTDEGFDTPLAFDLGFGRTVEPQDAAGRPDDLADQTAARTGECGTVEHTEEAYDRSPDYDEFWLERDYLHDAEFRAAALITHGWQDYNVKQRQAIDLWEAMPVDDPATDAAEGAAFKLLWMDQATHSGPSGDGYADLEREFFETTLQGADVGGALAAALETPVRTIGRTADGAADERFETAWPPVGTGELTLWLDRWFDYDLDGLPQSGLVGSTGETGVLGLAPQDTGLWTWVDTGTATEPGVEHDPLNEPGHGYYSLFFQTPPLAEDVRIAGSAVLDAWLRSERGAGTHVTPVLLDVAPDGTMQVVERGFLNLDYRRSLREADPLPPGGWGRIQLPLLPQDYTFEAGHRIALLTMSSNTVWAVPGESGGFVNIATGHRPDDKRKLRSKLILPVVDAGDESALFAEPVPQAP